LAFGTTSIVISSVETGQKEPFELFHLKVYMPVVSPVTVVVGDAGLVITGVFGPLITDQYPDPMVMVLAAMVAVVTPHLNWSGPAAAIVGGVDTLICTSSKLLVHELFEMVHLNP
jgi:Na+/pantothenate symporter